MPVLTSLTRVREDEIPAAIWACGFFFCVLSSYFILRPVREAMGLQGGVDALSWLFMGTALAMLAVNPLFSAIVTRFPRRTFIPIVYRFFMLNLAAFFLVFGLAQERIGLRVGQVFFVWLSVFNFFAVAVFWSFMADVFSLEQSKRLFGLIGLGGTLGAIAGAAFTARFAQSVGAAPLMLISIGLLEAAVQCFRQLDRLSIPHRVQPASVQVPNGLVDHPGETHGSSWSGIALVFTSPYLINNCLYILCMAVLGTFLYFAQARIVADAAQGIEQRSAIFARIDLWTQILTLVTQTFLTGRLIKRFGVVSALVLLPVILALGFIILSATPTLSILVAFQVLTSAARHGITRPARETLFTVVTKEEKYKSKGFIDTFVYRLGDLVGALSDKALAALGLGLTALAAVSVPLAAVWAGIGIYLAGKQRRLASARTAVWTRNFEGVLLKELDPALATVERSILTPREETNK